MHILEKVYTHNAHHAVRDILQTYDRKGRCVVSFLYFANLMRYRLLEQPQGAEGEAYLKALLHADFLLPDGIALQLFYRYHRHGGKSLTNLNGTDFTPILLSHLDSDRTAILMYGGTPEVVARAKGFLQAQGRVVLYAQDGYSPLDWDGVTQALQGHTYTARVLLVGRGTPRQEIWGEENRALYEQHKLLVFHIGGLFDFWGGAERRAPKRMVQARVLETPRRILTNPSKNLRKFIWMFGVVGYRWRHIFSGK